MADHEGANYGKAERAVADAVSNSEETTFGPNKNTVYGADRTPTNLQVNKAASKAPQGAALPGGAVGSEQKQNLPTSEKDKDGPPAKRIRPAVGAEALVVLTASYNQHFAIYCCGRKKVVQKIPAAVWKLVYRDFLQDQEEKCLASGEPFDSDKLPQERTLQDALRSALNDINTGISDEAHGKATVQDVDLMTRLKESDMYNRKKMGSFRESLVSNSSNHTGSVNNEKPQTRKELLKDAVDSIKQMSDVVDSGSNGLVDAIEHQNKVLEDDLTGKKELRAPQLAAQQSQEVDRVINRLITLKNNGILSEEEFTRRVKDAAGL